MRAVVYDGFGSAPSVREVPEPTCPPGGALIRVEATGLCRSDWHGWRGHDPDIALPHVPGHEFAGRVAAVDAPGWPVGERVTAPFVCACGECPTCRRGDAQVCERQSQPGFTHWGSFADYVAIEHAAVNLIRLPEALPSVAAAGLGCRVATAYRAVRAQGRAGPGTTLAVHGCGGVGLAAIQIAVAAGATVIGVDVSEPALVLAEDAGAQHVIDARTGDAAAQIVALTGGGADVSIDALGRATTYAASLACLRRRGRHVQVGLLAGADAATPLDGARVIARELEIIGSHGLAAGDYPALLADVIAGRIAPDRLVCRVIGLDEAPDALVAMDGPSGPGVTVITP
ncbi:MAG: zinc-dependent alcohol dehydrogenase family protein [Mycobacteriales bacterium]